MNAAALNVLEDESSCMLLFLLFACSEGTNPEVKEVLAAVRRAVDNEEDREVNINLIVEELQL